MYQKVVTLKTLQLFAVVCKNPIQWVESTLNLTCVLILHVVSIHFRLLPFTSVCLFQYQKSSRFHILINITVRGHPNGLVTLVSNVTMFKSSLL